MVHLERRKIFFLNYLKSFVKKPIFPSTQEYEYASLYNDTHAIRVLPMSSKFKASSIFLWNNYFKAWNVLLNTSIQWHRHWILHLHKSYVNPMWIFHASWHQPKHLWYWIHCSIGGSWNCSEQIKHCKSLCDLLQHFDKHFLMWLSLQFFLLFLRWSSSTIQLCWKD